MPKNLAIVIERPDLYTITCNGQPVAAKPNDWWLDKAFGRIDIAQRAQTGENVVTIKAAPSRCSTSWSQPMCWVTSP